MNSLIIKVRSWLALQPWLLALPIVLVPLGWYQGGEVFIWSDYYFSPNQADQFWSNLFLWQQSALGSAAYNRPANNFPDGLYHLISTALGLSWHGSQVVLMMLGVAANFFGMYWLVSHTNPGTEKARRWGGVLAGMTYVCNPWTVETLSFTNLSAALSPLFIYFYYQGLAGNQSAKQFWLSQLALTLTCSAAFSNIRNLIFFALYLGLILLPYWLLHWRQTPRIAKYNTKYVATFIGFNLFWLFPLMQNAFEVVSVSSMAYKNLGWDRNIAYGLASQLLSNAIRAFDGSQIILGTYRGDLYTPWIHSYKTPIFLVAGFAVPLFGFVIFALKKFPKGGQSALPLSWLLFCLFGLFHMQGANNALHQYLSQNVPFFLTAFSLGYAFGGGFYLIGIAALSGMTTTHLLNRPSWVKKGIISVFVLALLVNGSSFFTGSFWYPGGKVIPSANVRIPPEYPKAKAWLSTQPRDMRLYELPYSRVGYYVLDWEHGYNGPDLTADLLGQPVVNGLTVGAQIAEVADEMSFEELSNALGMLGVGQLLFHHDAALEYIRDVHQYIIPSAQLSDRLLNEGSTDQGFGKLQFLKIPEEDRYPMIFSPELLIEEPSQSDWRKLAQTIVAAGDKRIGVVSKTGIFLAESNRASSAIPQQNIRFRAINPTTYNVSIQSPPAAFPLILNQSYHPKWRITRIEYQQGSKYGSETPPGSLFYHNVGNQFANYWWVDLAKLEGLNSERPEEISFTLQFSRQKYAWAASWISLVVVFFSYPLIRLQLRRATDKAKRFVLHQNSRV